MRRRSSHERLVSPASTIVADGSAALIADRAARRSETYPGAHCLADQYLPRSGSFHICHWRSGIRGSSGCEAQNVPDGPYRCTRLVRTLAYGPGLFGGDAGSEGSRAAHGGVTSTTGSTCRPARVAAPMTASGDVKSRTPGCGSMVRHSSATRVLPAPEARINASSEPRSTVGAKIGPSAMTPKNDAGTAARADAGAAIKPTATTSATARRI